jgi:hypothetical protein
MYEKLTQKYGYPYCHHKFPFCNKKSNRSKIQKEEFCYTWASTEPMSEPMMSTKSMKTPLRYAGGKSRAVYKLENFLPNMDGVDEIHDCFLGGGSFPIHLTKLFPNKIVRVNDLYEPIYNFWTQLRDDGEETCKRLLAIKQNNATPALAKVLFGEQKEVMKDRTKSNPDRAVAF